MKDLTPFDELGEQFEGRGKPRRKKSTADSTIAAVEKELGDWHKRGGKVEPHQVVGGEIPMPGGLYGGEFSDSEMRGYDQAGQKLEQMKRLAAIVQGQPATAHDVTNTSHRIGRDGFKNPNDSYGDPMPSPIEHMDTAGIGTMFKPSDEDRQAMLLKLAMALKGRQ